jgi:hypothetical protein
MSQTTHKPLSEVVQEIIAVTPPNPASSDRDKVSRDRDNEIATHFAAAMSRSRFEPPGSPR